MTDEAAAATRHFHNTTKLHDGPEGFAPQGHPDGFKPMDPENRPTPFKRYPSAPRVALTTDVGESQASPLDVLAGNAAVEAPGSLDAALLARLLFYSTGVTRVRSNAEGVAAWFRAAPAAGNLHPVETYVVCGQIGDVRAGIHHFGPGDFSLETIREGDQRGQLSEAVAEDAVRTAPVSLVLTGVPWRTGWKYTARGLRHIYWDAGSLLAQTLAVADAAGVAARVHLGFVDRDISEQLGIDGVSEFPVAVVTLGEGSASASEVPAGPLLGGEPEPTSKHPIGFPLVTETQRAGDLADAAEVQQWRKAAAQIGRATTDGSVVEAVPGSDDTASNVEELIRRRGSTRMFRPEEIDGSAARWALAVASRPMPGDFCAPGTTLLSHFVSVHEIAGVPSGRHQWVGAALEIGQEDPVAEARSEAQRLCLGQPLGGDSAFSVFHCVDLDEVLSALGDRGYRAAQLEAGLAAGRLQLAAFAVGLGATGLTFFDDAVPPAFGSTEACMLVTAVGPSDYRSRAGGLPGKPTEMSGFAPEVVTRFQARVERLSR